ncbi:MAG TPA: sialidase family protein [Amycolatopsis sp.]|nr:sialidase family protein [Amycolatopsis sp.]
MRWTSAICAAAVLGLAMTASPAEAAESARAVSVSHGDPFASCTLGSETGVNYAGAEVEPSVAVDPVRHDRFVGVFQQDRWSDGGAKGLVAAFSPDGGRTVGESLLPFSACVPGGLPYERASDAWVSIGPDGTAYASGLNFDVKDVNNGVGAATSFDGGRTWTHTTELIADTQPEFFNDKNSVTADPVRAGTAYQVWDRLDAGPGGDGSKLTGPAMLSVTHDFGRTWSRPQLMVDTAANQQTIGNIVLADPRTGVLYDVFNLITYTDPSATQVVSANMSLVSSADRGRTWSAPVTVAADTSIAETDPNTGAALRAGAGLPSAAIDRTTGALYVTYEGTDFTAGKLDQVQLVRSTDGGRSWTAPRRINGAPKALAFTPAVAVAADGTVGVSYYDLRDLRPGNTTTLPTATWLTTSRRGGEHFGEERRLAPDFDALLAPNAGGFMVGDYEGLAAAGRTFRPLFMATNTGSPANTTDIFTATPRDAVQATASSAPAFLSAPSAHPRTRH